MWTRRRRAASPPGASSPVVNGKERSDGIGALERARDSGLPRARPARRREERGPGRHRRPRRRRALRLRRQTPSGNIDPGRRVPSKDTYKIDGYNGRTGAFLWRIELGWNVNHGIWFSPMVVRDLDGDGKAEVCLRTAPFAATRDQMFTPEKPFVLEGPEYLSVLLRRDRQRDRQGRLDRARTSPRTGPTTRATGRAAT